MCPEFELQKKKCCELSAVVLLRLCDICFIEKYFLLQIIIKRKCIQCAKGAIKEVQGIVNQLTCLVFDLRGEKMQHHKHLKEITHHS